MFPPHTEERYLSLKGDFCTYIVQVLHQHEKIFLIKVTKNRRGYHKTLCSIRFSVSVINLKKLNTCKNV
jgi:hypothetical protein